MVDEAVDTYNRNLKGKCYNQFLEVGLIIRKKKYRYNNRGTSLSTVQQIW